MSDYPKYSIDLTDREATLVESLAVEAIARLRMEATAAGTIEILTCIVDAITTAREDAAEIDEIIEEDPDPDPIEAPEEPEKVTAILRSVDNAAS